MTMVVCKFFSAFMSLLTAPFVKKIHILARVYFIFLKNILDQTWKSCNTKIGPQWKDRKSSYEVIQVLALFCNLVTLVAGWNCVKGLKVTKIGKYTKFKGAWSKLEA